MLVFVAVCTCALCAHVLCCVHMLVWCTLAHGLATSSCMRAFSNSFVFVLSWILFLALFFATPRPGELRIAQFDSSFDPLGSFDFSLYFRVAALSAVENGGACFRLDRVCPLLCPLRGCFLRAGEWLDTRPTHTAPGDESRERPAASPSFSCGSSSPPFHQCSLFSSTE